MPAKITDRFLHEIQYPSWCTDDNSRCHPIFNLTRILQHPCLRFLWYATKYCHTGNTEGFPQRRKGLVCLQGQFSGRRDDKDGDSGGAVGAERAFEEMT